LKNFTRQDSWLSKSSLEIRVIYALFILFALVGHLSFILISLSRIGPTYGKIVEHYRGGEQTEAAGTEEMSFPKEFPELLEVTHFHAYIEGIVLLVLAHLFAGVPLSRGVKLGVIGLSFGATFLDLASPWLIRYLSPQAAYAQMAAWIGMGAGYIPLTLVPLYYLFAKGAAPSKDRRKHKDRDNPHS
jgi:hypothetical protein